MAFFEITKAAILFFVFCHSVELPQANNQIQDSTDAGSTSPLGHMQKLGSHMDPFGVTFVGKFNNPAVFYNHFIKPGKPLQFKNVLEDLRHPGLSEWTDKYLKRVTFEAVFGRGIFLKSGPKIVTVTGGWP